MLVAVMPALAAPAEGPDTAAGGRPSARQRSDVTDVSQTFRKGDS